MKQFMALLRLQLLSKYADLKPRNLKTALKEKKGRTVGMIFLILFLVLYLGGMLFYLETQMIDALLKYGMADMLVTLAVVFATVGTIILSFFFVLSSLFLGRDAAYLASLPLKPRTILGAKLTQVWISETGINALIILPACILYGIKTGAAAIFYVRMVVVWLLIAILPICLIAILSTLLIRLSALWKHKEMLLTVGGIVFLFGYMYLMMNLGAMSGDAAEGGNMIQNLLLNNTERITSMTQLFPPTAWAAEGMLGQNNTMFMVWILISLAAPVLLVWLLGYGYRKLSMLQSETPASPKKKFTGRESFAAGGQLKACILREIKTILRVPSYATNILPISFMPVVMIIMMSVLIGRITGSQTAADAVAADAAVAAADAAANGAQSIGSIFAEMFPAQIMCIMAGVMAYMGGLSPALCTAVTREGKGHDFLTALPVPTSTFIRAKFIVGYGLNVIGLAAATVALIVLFPGFELQACLALALCLLYLYTNACLSLSRDIKKPRLDWVTEQEAVKQNFGVLISMAISWVILVTVGILAYFLISRGLDMWLVFGILGGVLLVLCIVTRSYMYKTADKYYCEK